MAFATKNLQDTVDKARIVLAQSGAVSWQPYENAQILHQNFVPELIKIGPELTNN